eukprot:Awhi_evm2s13125
MFVVSTIKSLPSGPGGPHSGGQNFPNPAALASLPMPSHSSLHCSGVGLTAAIHCCESIG